MYLYKLIIIAFVFCSSQFSFGQKTKFEDPYHQEYEQVNPKKINKLINLDQSLRILISEFIKESKSKNILFNKGMGFVKFERIFEEISNGSYNANVFKLSLRAYPLLMKQNDECISCNIFPTYFMKIDGIYVLFFDDILTNIHGFEHSNQISSKRSKTSRKQLSRRINNSLIKIDDSEKIQILQDSLTIGELKKFSEERSKCKFKDKKEAIWHWYEFQTSYYSIYKKIAFDSSSKTWSFCN